MPPNVTAERTALDAIPAKLRSARTNGRRMFVDGDGCSPWARRRRDILVRYVDDLQRRFTVLSAFQEDLAETAATLRAEIEKIEGKLSKGEDVDVDKLGRLAGHHRRVCETLGIETAPAKKLSLRDSILAGGCA